MSGRYFSDLSKGRQNNFDFLRFVLACSVVLAHSFSVLNGDTLAGYDPLVLATRSQFSLGGGAVLGFFLISGLLISQSWMYSKGFGDYLRKRAYRILPALIVVLLMTVFLLGPLVTTERNTYFTDPATYRYLWFMLTKNLHITDRLPGVFTHNPVAFRVNGSLWTIRCEFLCYLLVAFLGMMGVYRKRILVLIGAVAVATFTTWYQTRFRTAVGDAEGLIGPLRVGAFFLVGMAFYFYQDRIPYSGRLFALAIGTALAATYWNFLAWPLPYVYAYITFYIAYHPSLRLNNFAKHGDLSYGLYLYAFPVQQALVSCWGHRLTPLGLMASALAISCACAALSWRYVESPFLRKKAKDAARTAAVVHVAESPASEPATADVAGR